MKILVSRIATALDPSDLLILHAALRAQIHGSRFRSA